VRNFILPTIRPTFVWCKIILDEHIQVVYRAPQMGKEFKKSNVTVPLIVPVEMDIVSATVQRFKVQSSISTSASATGDGDVTARSRT
jgi:hypothetical protein